MRFRLYLEEHVGEGPQFFRVSLTSSSRWPLLIWGRWAVVSGARCTFSSISVLFRRTFLWSSSGGRKALSLMLRDGMSPQRRCLNPSLRLCWPQLLEYGQLLSCFSVAAVGKVSFVVFLWCDHRAGIRSVLRCALRFCKFRSRGAH